MNIKINHEENDQEQQITTEEKSYVKAQAPKEERKLFQNKKANIALGIVAGVIVLVIIAAIIIVNI